ncbi:MAG: hypothetical protein HS101_14045 [Planctomycetia bacterium]|jgi:hypothetical protein
MDESESRFETLDSERGTIVFLLGAGCSADCEVPVMARFLEVARSRMRTASDKIRRDYERTFEFRNSCASISRIFDRWWDDVEQLMTQAQIMEIAEEDFERGTSKAISRVIWDVCRRTRSKRPCGYLTFRLALQSLIIGSQRSECPRPVIITTNYDLNLESAIADLRSVAEGNPLLIHYPGIETPLGEVFIHNAKFRNSQHEDGPQAVEVIRAVCAFL